MAKRKILTQAEMDCLLEVKTTACQARQIKRRNLAIIRMLKKGKSDVISIGCPHCQGSCNGCAYEIWNDGKSYSSWCLDGSFGGITARDITCVELSSDDVEVQVEGRGPEEIKKAIEWAQGHVEWAEKVIRLCAKRPSKKGKKRCRAC